MTPFFLQEAYFAIPLFLVMLFVAIFTLLESIIITNKTIRRVKKQKLIDTGEHQKNEKIFIIVNFIAAAVLFVIAVLFFYKIVNTSLF